MFIHYFNNNLISLGTERRSANLDVTNKTALLEHYKSSCLTKGGKLLVLFLYNNYEEMRLTRMHPECFMVDITHGTNKERKELFTVTGKDGNNFAFNVYRGCIPNQQQWVFHFLFSQSLPIFF